MSILMLGLLQSLTRHPFILKIQEILEFIRRGGSVKKLI